MIYKLRLLTLFITTAFIMALNACVKDNSATSVVSKTLKQQVTSVIDSSFTRFPTLFSINKPEGIYNSQTLGDLPAYLYKSDPQLAEPVPSSVGLRIIVNQKTFVYLKSKPDPLQATVTYTAAMWNARKTANDFVLPITIDATDIKNTSQLLVNFKMMQKGGTFPMTSMEFFMDAVDDNGNKFVAVYRGTDGYISGSFTYNFYQTDMIESINGKFSTVLKLVNPTAGITWTGPKTVKLVGAYLRVPATTIIQ